MKGRERGAGDWFLVAVVAVLPPQLTLFTLYGAVSRSARGPSRPTTARSRAASCEEGDGGWCGWEEWAEQVAGTVMEAR